MSKLCRYLYNETYYAETFRTSLFEIFAGTYSLYVSAGRSLCAILCSCVYSLLTGGEHQMVCSSLEGIHQFLCTFEHMPVCKN